LKRKRISKKNQDLIQSFIFFLSTALTISGLIAYLWVYTEIDEAVLAIEIQRSTANELKNEIEELDSIIESLQRADVISDRAYKELKMINTDPETLIVHFQNFHKLNSL
jgi:hypothetical protein